MRDIDLDGMEVDYNICLRDLQDFSEGKIGIFIDFFVLIFIQALDCKIFMKKQNWTKEYHVNIVLRISMYFLNLIIWKNKKELRLS